MNQVSFQPTRYLRSTLDWFLKRGVTIALLGMGTLIVPDTLHPSIVQAYEARLNITIDQAKDESFQTMVKRAEIVARAAIQRSFDADILATDAIVFVNAQRGGLEAPLLSVQISRFQWTQFPDARRWATYYPSTRILLKLDEPLATEIPAIPAPIVEPPAPEAGTQIIPPDTIPPLSIPTTLPTSLPPEEQKK